MGGRRIFVSAVILAAGESTRFPGGKLTQRVLWRGKAYTLIKLLTHKYLDTRLFSEVLVVVGHKPQDIMVAVNDPLVKFVYNPEYRLGMSYSVKAGVKPVLGYADILFIHPGDVPFISIDTLKALAERSIELYKDGRDFILLPRYRGKGGHPLAVSKKLIPYILEIREEERGLKGFLRRFSNYKIFMDTSDLGVVYDIDTPEDLERAEKLFGIKWLKDHA